MITLVIGDGWVGLYRDGELLAQDHSIPAERILTLAGVEHQYVEADLDWLMEAGRLPQSLDDVRRLE